MGVIKMLIPVLLVLLKSVPPTIKLYSSIMSAIQAIEKVITEIKLKSLTAVGEIDEVLKRDMIFLTADEVIKMMAIDTSILKTYYVRLMTDKVIDDSGMILDRRIVNIVIEVLVNIM